MSRRPQPNPGVKPPGSWNSIGRPVARAVRLYIIYYMEALLLNWGLEIIYYILYMEARARKIYKKIFQKPIDKRFCICYTIVKKDEGSNHNDQHRTA